MSSKTLNPTDLPVKAPLPTSFAQPWPTAILQDIQNTNLAMPDPKKIPTDYNGRQKFEDLQAIWFFKGLDQKQKPNAKPGTC